MNYQLTPLIKSPTGDYHVAKDDTVRCWVCSGSGDVKDKKATIANLGQDWMKYPVALAWEH